MTDKQPEALRLAQYLIDCNRLDLTCDEAAAELRRLHGENEVLRQFLSQIPPQREWQGLTDDEIMDLCAAQWASHPIEVARIIEAKLKEKNR